MPCYTAWYKYVTPNTPEYDSAKREVQAKLKAVKHIVDYYYRAFEYPLPNLPISTAVDPMRQPKSSSEMSIRQMICHHFACDGIDFCTLYDVCSIIDTDDDAQRPYAAVVLPCATLMRQTPKKYVVSY